MYYESAHLTVFENAIVRELKRPGSPREIDQRDLITPLQKSGFLGERVSSMGAITQAVNRINDKCDLTKISILRSIQPYSLHHTGIDASYTLKLCDSSQVSREQSWNGDLETEMKIEEDTNRVEFGALTLHARNKKGKIIGTIILDENNEVAISNAFTRSVSITEMSEIEELMGALQNLFVGRSTYPTFTLSNGNDDFDFYGDDFQNMEKT